MQTLIIYDRCGQAPLEFKLFDEDLSMFDGVYINEFRDEAGYEKKVEELMFALDREHQTFEKFPLALITEMAAEGKYTNVIVCGFLP